MTREWGGIVDGGRPTRPRQADASSAGRRRGRHGAGAARERAVRAHRRARPRAAAALPALPPRPLAGPVLASPSAPSRGQQAAARCAPATRRRWPAAWCSPPTASCCRRTRWSTTRPPRPSSTPSSPTCSTRALPPMTATRITPGLADAPADVDVVVVGLGVTGAGVALDAASRGLSRARRRRPRPRLRHLALVLEARARRAALPGQRPGRRGAWRAPSSAAS